jgi:Fe-S oxidoreductase
VAGRITKPIARHAGKVVLHGHCHQKAFGVMGAVTAALGLVEGLEVETVDSSCCGMAGAFGYGADTHQASLAMGELSLLPAVRRAPVEATIAADGFSCRHQIHDGTGRTPLHVVRILRRAMDEAAATQRSAPNH